MIEARRLTRRYGGFVAVDEVSFAISPGEVVGLLGPNGAGKTTIMKMLTGFLEPSSGQVLVDGIEVEKDPSAVQAQLGYLPENLPLYPELSVIDYLAYAADLRRVEDIQGAVTAAIEATDLGSKALDLINTLSRGFMQRVGVAQAILHKPRFLILDEPTNGLDPAQIQHMRQLVRELASSATIILSTHIMQEVNAICDRALILRNGALVFDERLKDLQQTNRLRLRTSATAPVESLIAELPAASVVEVVASGNEERTCLVDVDGSLREAADKIAQVLVGANAPIYELRPEQRDLETLFRKVSEGATP